MRGPRLPVYGPGSVAPRTERKVDVPRVSLTLVEGDAALIVEALKRFETFYDDEHDIEYDLDEICALRKRVARLMEQKGMEP